MRILHINNISGVASTLSNELRRRGIQSEVLVLETSIYGFPYDHLITGRSFAKIFKAILKARNYDIVHWHYPKQRRIIKIFSRFKSVLKHYHGSDLRGRRENGFCILAMPELLDYAPKGLYLPHPIKLEEIKPVYETGNKKPIVCWYRSTITRVDIIEKAFKDLEDRCVSLELKGLTHEEALDTIAESDIFIDIRTNGWYGLSAAEAMAYGKPVIGNIRKDFAEKYGPPALQCSTYENLAQTLESLLSDSKLRIKAGKDSRRYAEDAHNVRKSVDILLPIYESLI